MAKQSLKFLLWLSVTAFTVLSILVCIGGVPSSEAITLPSLSPSPSPSPSPTPSPSPSLSPSPTPTPTPSTTLAKYLFEGNFLDSSGYANHATGYAGVTFQQIVTNRVANFDGIKGYLGVARITGLTSTTPYSVSLWVKPEFSTRDQLILSLFGETTRIITQGHDILARISTTATPSGQDIPLGQIDERWHHITLTFNGTTCTAYFDAVKTGALTAVPNFVSNIIYIGGNPNAALANSSEPIFKGFMDEVVFYNRALTLQEILYIFGNKEYEYALSSKVWVAPFSGADVYSQPSLDSLVVSHESQGSAGVITYGRPTTTGITTFWQVKFTLSTKTGWVDARVLSSMDTTSMTPEATAVGALIRYVNPSAVLTGLNTTKLTTTQIANLKSALTALSGKKFVIYKGKVLLLDGLDAYVTNTNDIVTLDLYKGWSEKGSVVLADLSQVSTPNICPEKDGNNQPVPWDQYLFCLLDNYAKANPSKVLGEDAGLLTDIRSILEGRFGNFAQNFEITGGNSIIVRPKAGNSLGSPDNLRSLSFSSNPYFYDKEFITEYLGVFKTEVMDPDPNFFYIFGTDAPELMSVYDIKEMTSPAQAFLPAEGCSYEAQIGSPLPCNNKINLIETNDKFPHSYGPIKKFKMLGYDVSRIDADAYSDEGIDFLAAVVNSQGQIIAHNFHHPADAAGFHIPFGCVYHKDVEDGTFLSRLNNTTLFKKKPLGPQDIYTQYWPGCNFFKGKKMWGIRLTDTIISPRAIQAGYMCHGATSPINASAHYLTVANSTSGSATVADLLLFSQYLLGLGPMRIGTSGTLYQYYPPRLNRPYNLDVANIDDDGLGTGSCGAGCQEVNATPGSFGEDVQGGRVKVRIPISTNPDGTAHLFPYVTNLAFGSEANLDSNQGRISFGDPLGNIPTLDFKIKGIPAIEGGLTPLYGYNQDFSFKFIPEVEVISKSEFDSPAGQAAYKPILKQLVRDINIALFKASGAKAAANGIEMIGNTLAEFTYKNLLHGFKHFFYDTYFWAYNARATNGADMRTFQANLMFKRHPWVSSVTQGEIAEGGMSTVKIDFSKDVDTSPAACQAVTVDASQCTNQKAIFKSPPAFLKGSAKEGWGRIAFSLINDITLYWDQAWLPQSDVGSNGIPKAKLIIKINSASPVIRSFWKKFPLMGNTLSPSFWLFSDVNKNGKADVWEKNSDKLPQTEGKFEVWIPCAPRKSACCYPRKGPDNSPGVAGLTDCKDTSYDDCTRNLKGIFQDGKNCLQHDYFGEAKQDGSISGMCPSPCKRQPQIFDFIYREEMTQGCEGCEYAPAPGPGSANETALVQYSFAVNCSTGCPPRFLASTGGGCANSGCADNGDRFGNVESDCIASGTCPDCTQLFHHARVPVVLQQFFHDPDRVVCPCKDPPNPCTSDTGGAIGCNGGYLKDSAKVCLCEDCTTTRKVWVQRSRQSCDPATEYAVQTSRGGFVCCGLNQKWNYQTETCEPMFSGLSCGYSGSPVSVPAAPSGFSVTLASLAQVQLAWVDNSVNETGFTIERKTSSGEYRKIGTVAAGIRAYTDTTATPGLTYSYRVTAFNASGNSGGSNEVVLSIPPMSDFPASFTASMAGFNKIQLQWQGTSDDEAYVLERAIGTTSTTAFSVLVTLPAGTGSYLDTTAVLGISCNYRLKVQNRVGSSEYVYASATIPGIPPAAPTFSSATIANSAQITLTWTDNANNEQGFKIERRTGAAGSFAELSITPALGENTATYTDTAVTPGNTYYYKIKAWNSKGTTYAAATKSVMFSVPAAPTNLWGMCGSSGNPDFTWLHNGVSVDDFIFERKSKDDYSNPAIPWQQVNVVVPGDSRSITLQEAYGFTKYYRIRARNKLGVSAPSNEITPPIA